MMNRNNSKAVSTLLDLLSLTFSDLVFVSSAVTIMTISLPSFTTRHVPNLREGGRKKKEGGREGGSK